MAWYHMWEIADLARDCTLHSSAKVHAWHAMHAPAQHGISEIRRLRCVGTSSHKYSGAAPAALTAWAWAFSDSCSGSSC